MVQQKLLNVTGLKTHFHTSRKHHLTAVDDITFQIKEGDILGIVGESGSGKSVTCQSITRLLNERTTSYEGSVNFQGHELLSLPLKKMQSFRGNKISMIFQDPLGSLNPTHTIGQQIMEAILLHQNLSRGEALKKTLRMLELTGISSPEKRIKEFPHQLSGGMQQRVMIAIALACEPKLLIADEPTTALDVTIQAQILELIINLTKKRNMAVMFITHDLGVVAELCTRVAVMYLGQIVEEADVDNLFFKPLHPYTRGLIKSIPQLHSNRSQKLHFIEGTVPSLNNIPKGCRFAPRCPFADNICYQHAPELKEYREGQEVRCWHTEKIIKEEGVSI